MCFVGIAEKNRDYFSIKYLLVFIAGTKCFLYGRNLILMYNLD